MSTLRRHLVQNAVTFYSFVNNYITICELFVSVLDPNGFEVRF